MYAGIYVCCIHLYQECMRVHRYEDAYMYKICVHIILFIYIDESVPQSHCINVYMYLRSCKISYMQKKKHILTSSVYDYDSSTDMYTHPKNIYV